MLKRGRGENKIKWYSILLSWIKSRIKLLEFFKEDMNLLTWPPWSHHGAKGRGSGMPWWYSEQESACQWRGHGFGLGSGKIPYVKEQLRPCVTATVRMLRGPRVNNYWACEPQLPRPMHPRAGAPQWEKSPQWERSPCSMGRVAPDCCN